MITNYSELKVQKNNETLYRDYCCHLNNKGVYLLANEIVNNFSYIFKEILDKNI